jgi:hypothetical protein
MGIAKWARETVGISLQAMHREPVVRRVKPARSAVPRRGRVSRLTEPLGQPRLGLDVLPVERRLAG